ncbi:MAG: hypothetical protein GY789_28130 [Hyphomicrobiales bacterium]|nr:hypothetical protein [Hyphomicrobiales bacterium]
MGETANTDRLVEIINAGTPEDCINFFSSIPQKERRQFSAASLNLFKQWDKAQFETMMDGKNRTDVHPDVARVAVLASASISQVKSCGWNICPPPELMVRVYSEFQPDWLEAWVGHMLDDNPFNLSRVRAIWEAGLCQKPDRESYVLAMIVAPRHSLWPDSDTKLNPESWKNREPLAARVQRHPDLIPDLWRFFEVEGTGEFSLAAYDKYSSADNSWTAALLELSDKGLIDRSRLLDASLDALARDFAQFRAGWFSRFFEALTPTQDELVTRKEHLLRLTGSVVPPTVSFALKTIKKIDKSEPFEEIDLVKAMLPVVQARQKGTAMTGLRLIATAVKREPAVRENALPVVLSSLIHEAADVQSKSLDLLDEFGVKDHPQLLAKIDDYLDGLAPSVRPRASTLSGTKATASPQMPVAVGMEQIETTAIDSFDAFIVEFLHVLEDTTDPLRIERVIDGLARHGASMPSDFERITGPLAKRADQILGSASDTNLRYGLAHLADQYCQKSHPEMPERMVFGSMVSLGWSRKKNELGETNFVSVFIKRNADMLGQVLTGLSLPLLCAPTDSRGFIAPITLVERVCSYETAGVAPSAYDLGMALMRMDVQGRKKALTILEPSSEATRALSFALGGELNIGKLNVGKTKWLWVAAAAARYPRADMLRIARLSGVIAPDVGVEAKYEISVSSRESGGYVFHEAAVNTSPEIRGVLPDTYLPGLFHLTTAGNFSGSVCGHHADDIRWASTVWPQNLEPFYSQGATVFDADQKLSNSPYAAFIEPMLLQQSKLGPIGHFLLSQSLASTDAAVRSLSVEAVIVCIEGNRLDADLFADATRALILKARFPAARWTRALGEVMRVSQSHALFLTDLLSKIVHFDPDDLPRDAGGMVELLYELHVETNQRLTNENTRQFLSSVSAGGKVSKFSKLILSL